MIITNSTTIMKRFVSKVIPTLLNNSAINPAARSICLSCANNASIPLTTSTRVSPTKSIAITLPQHQRMHISDFPQQQQQQQQQNKLARMKVFRTMDAPTIRFPFVVGSLVRRYNSTQPQTATAETEGLILTDSCTKRIKHIRENDEQMLRITVDSGGCHGFQVKFSVTDKMNPDDIVFERDGAKVVTDEVSLGFIKGSKIDYKEEMVSSSFRVIDNPQSQNSCGCGTSFALKE